MSRGCFYLLFSCLVSGGLHPWSNSDKHGTSKHWQQLWFDRRLCTQCRKLPFRTRIAKWYNVRNTFKAHYWKAWQRNAQNTQIKLSKIKVGKCRKNWVFNLRVLCWHAMKKAALCHMSLALRLGQLCCAHFLNLKHYSLRWTLTISQPIVLLAWQNPCTFIADWCLR